MRTEDYGDTPHNPQRMYMQYPNGAKVQTGWTCFVPGHGSQVECVFAMAWRQYWEDHLKKDSSNGAKKR